MIRTLLGIALVAGMTCTGQAAGPADELIKKIQDNGHKRVGVIPTVMQRNGDEESTVGALGPRGNLMAHEIYTQLVAASHDGGFRVVPERTMRRAMKSRGVTSRNLSDRKVVVKLADECGADTLVSLTHDYDTNKLLNELLTKDDFGDRQVDRINAETIDAKDGFVTYSKDFDDERTLSKAAYQGESWELRRWTGSKLKNVGLRLDDDDEKIAFGKGHRWESLQYASLSNDIEHPRDIDGFPYSFDILVDGKIRKPRGFDGVHGKSYVVELNPGENYTVVLNNKSNKPVYCALYIDGMNSIDKKRQEPADTEARRHWYLKADSGVRHIAGWYSIDRDKDNKPTDSHFYNKFEIVPRDESVAFGEGFEDNIGMITAVFYTVGMNGIEEPDDSALRGRGIPKADFGTGSGERIDQSLQFSKQPNPGLMLGAVTIYYRTGDQIEAWLDKREISDPVSENVLAKD